MILHPEDESRSDSRTSCDDLAPTPGYSMPPMVAAELRRLGVLASECSACDGR